MLVTSGAGFIGSTCARHLIEGRWAALSGAEVVVLDALATGITWYAENRAWWEPLG